MKNTYVVNFVVQQERRIGDLFLHMDITECTCISADCKIERSYQMYAYIYDVLRDIRAQIVDHAEKSWWDETTEWVARKQRDFAALAQILERNVV